MKVRQVSLESVENPGKMRVVWTNEIEGFGLGAVVSLKGESERFKVTGYYEPELDKADIKHGWHVGGL